MQQKNNIVMFDNWEEFREYLGDKRLTKKLGEGGEGTCYLSSKDNSVYKVMERSLFEYTSRQYELNEIITTKDIELKNFVMPEELYALRKSLVGYKTKYITPDLFDYYNLMKNYENIYKINFCSLKKAYYEMLKEIEKLSAEKIKICDLSCNLMFTGKKLVGIDTCFYRRVAGDTFESNIISLEEAIRTVFDSWLKYNPEIDEDEVYFVLDEKNIDSYLQKVSKITKKVRKRLQ